MEHSEFFIGLEFWCSDRQWRCTDVGTRVVAAIRIDEVQMVTSGGDGPNVIRTLDRAEAEADGWFSGPPYAVAEMIFDEYDFEGCSLEPDRAEESI